ncbi:MAG: DUF4349 domain-containing protein [Firmicutes bacterium]|nr:DUF4349 domain-containing protein [Bacillota bacterium]
MKCEQAQSLMHAYVDQEINDLELKKLNEHLDSCESCTVEFEELKYMIQVMGEMDLKELPIGYEEELHQKLIVASNEAQFDQATHKKQSFFSSVVEKLSHFKMKRRYYAYAAVPTMMLVVFFASKGLLNLSKNEMAVSSDMNYLVEETTAAAMFEESQARDGGEYGVSIGTAAKGTENMLTLAPSSTPEFTDQSDYRDGRMIIQTANISLDVEKYDSVLENIRNTVMAAGGYVENESTSFKWYYSDTDNLKVGYLTIRVPAEGYASFVTAIKDLGLVTMESSNASDITKIYRDTAAEVENLKVTEERLREIMQQATEIADILAIENELTRIRGDISMYTKQIQDWEALVDMASITINLNEVKSLKPTVEPIDDSLFGKAKEGFIDTINALKRLMERTIVWIVAKSPILLIITILGLIARWVYFKKFNVRRKSNEK